ncbi:MAG: ATP-binding cassette domain-containing protein [Flavobacteriaceae bacterium]|nr:ATP-binding cassette domain-containing protein [Mangrovimonas sp.]MCB0435299.1 ATP-binding cassette domain-containing protein [Mangrovimonas sp.]HPF97282.1 ATP-binding cassette domain-containing protein [Mangrovimonas sp.]HRV54772.1 ATP-binding cassette domain-containing protein [Mangrovimonas sp.]
MDVFLTPWRRFVGLLQLERRAILQVFYYAIFSGLVALSLPLGIQAIVNLIQGAQISTSWVVLVALVTLGVAFSGALKLMQLRIIENIQQKIFTRASFEFTYRFPKIKMDQLYNAYPPELANRFFDTLSVQKGLSKILIDVPTAILEILFALILLSFYHPFFIVFGLLLIVLIYVVFKFTASNGLKTSLKESKHKYKVAHWIQEVARTMGSFKISGKTNLALAKNDLLVSSYLDARESHFKVLLLQFVKMIGFKVVVTAALLIIGGLLVLNQEMNIGQFVAAEIIILLVIASVEKLILGLDSIYDVLTSIEKIGQVVDMDLENQEGEHIQLKDDFKVELQNLGMQTPDGEMQLLQNINLIINAKSRILIYGSNGSGKSSLLRTIAGLLEPTEGKLFINERNISSVNLNSYRKYLGLSLLEETPFEGTIRDNVTFGDAAILDEEIYQTFKDLDLIDFLKEQPNGLNTIIYPEGKQLSYTLSRKLILARAILKKPRLLILEDPLNQMAQEEAMNIIQLLTNPKNNWGLVVVSRNHDWETYCKECYEMKSGKIIK